MTKAVRKVEIFKQSLDSFVDRERVTLERTEH